MQNFRMETLFFADNLKKEKSLLLKVPQEQLRNYSISGIA